ncbi:MAG: DUF3592 domain-containing protein [Opitutales bacterium]|nr:DUF3592 domain-containing protein [Opitutales bacterium]
MSIFVLVGLSLAVYGCHLYLEEDAFAERAVPVPCKIISAEVKTSYGAKGKRSYSPELVYAYNWNGEEFRSNQINCGMKMSSSDYSEQWRLLNTLKKSKNCWVDPEDVTVASLEKPKAGFAGRKISPIIFGLVFAALPFVIVIVGIRSSKRKNYEQFEEEDDAPDSEMEFVAQPQKRSPIFTFVFSLGWLAFCVFLLMVLFDDMDTVGISLPFIVIGIFILVGLVIFVTSLYRLIKRSRDRDRGTPL